MIHFGHNCYLSYLLLISKSQMILAVPAWDHEGLLLNFVQYLKLSCFVARLKIFLEMLAKSQG